MVTRTLPMNALLVLSLLMPGPILTCGATSNSANTFSSRTASSSASASERQVQLRVRENIDYFMNTPVLATSLQADFFDLGGFPHQLEAPDRDLALQYMFSQVQTRQIKVYYGLESGVFVGYGDDFSFATSREPGESGFRVLLDEETAAAAEERNATLSQNELELQKYWNTCVNRDTGVPEPCRMSVGDTYIECQNNCEFVPCRDMRDSTNGWEANDDDTITDRIVEETKWCRNYTVESVLEEDEQQVARGYIPRTYHCINEGGQFTQTLGEALVVDDSGELSLGNCTFRDGTLVTREISGPFAYCGEDDEGEPQTCTSTHKGMHRTRDYDPRYRGWYVETAKAQRPTWSDPYTFFSNGEIGITWADPIYIEEDGRLTFQGILAVDYPLDAVSEFLIDAYKNTNTLVAIIEDKDPNYVVGVSTGSSTTKKVLISDSTVPCPADIDEECEVIRLPVTELYEIDADLVFQNAFSDLKDAGFPEDGFISVKVDAGSSMDGYYSAISIVYEHSNANLKWRILVANPIQRNASNTITSGQPLFLPLILISLLGFTACVALFVLFYRRRNERAVIYSDVRFTCAFIAGCALLNLTTLSLLGENTDAMCMTRMWSVHFMFALALSPLFVKVYRLWKLVGHSSAMRRPKITNLQATLYSVPIPAIQGIILLIFTFVDPPLQSESMELDGGALVPNIVCEHDSGAFFVTQLVFITSLICIGCLLAFVSRNMDPKFGEPKQMIFSMYNIAFTGVILIALFSAVDVEEDGRRMLHAIGIFWGTIVSSAAFVVPRLMQANTDNGVHISGLMSLGEGGTSAHTVLGTDHPEPQETASKSAELGASGALGS